MPVELVTLGAVCADVMVCPIESMPPRGKLALVDSLAMHLGGLAGVTAAVYSQLGGTAALVGRVGQDSFGDFLLRTLGQAGVNTSAVLRDPHACTSATVVMVSADGERTFLHHMGANAAIAATDLPETLLDRAQCLHWGGPSITPLLDGAAMGQVFSRARAAGLRTSMDTCYDGKNVWLPLIEPSLPHLDIVFSSLEEARMYSGRQDAPDIAAFYRGYGVGTVVVKLGEDGLYVDHANETFHVPGHRVPVLDTTGAGDAACGGYLYGYLRGWSAERCARLANAVGALTVQTMGGAEAIDSLESTVQFMEAVPCA